MKRPSWVGADSFSAAWSALERRGPQTAPALELLQVATVVAVDRALVADQPCLIDTGGPSAEAFYRLNATMRRLCPPADPLWLDTGRAPFRLDVVPFRDDGSRLAGGLLSRAPVLPGEPPALWVWPLIVVDGEPTFGSALTVGDREPCQLVMEALSERELPDGDTSLLAAAVAAERLVAALALVDGVAFTEAPLSRKTRARELAKGRRIALVPVFEEVA